MLYCFELYMHHNYYFRRKQHSYAACDAALAYIYIYILLLTAFFFSILRTVTLIEIAVSIAGWFCALLCVPLMSEMQKSSM